MPQFFLPPDAIEGDRFHLKGHEAKHIVKVLRYRAGQRLLLFDGAGVKYEGVIDAIGSEGTVSGLLERVIEGEAARRRVILHQALIKGDRWEWLLEKGTELGVAAFHPVTTSRTVVDFPADRGAAKLERWRKLVMAGAKQCGRADLPEVKEPVSLEAGLRACSGLVLVAWEGLAPSPANSLREMTAVERRASAVNLFIGPEGGFSTEEIALAESLGARPFSLGTQTLRSETAAIAALSLLLLD